MKIYLLIIFLLFSLSLLAQNKITISGTIKNTKNEVLPFSDVLLTTADKTKKILAFDLADAKAKYEISWTPDTNIIRLEAASMGYDKMDFVLELSPNKTKYSKDFVLNVRTEEIEEVNIVAAPEVQVREDTTIFNLAKIRDSTEVVVEDLLKKLPGITVKSGGQLEFKGKKVTHVLLDGDDLFDQNYTLGTQNIQADQVEGIEAVENFSENPLLRGVEITEDVAINLKFKPGLSLSNNLNVGYGYKERYDISHKSISVTKNVKAFTLFNHNNLGKNTGQGHYKASRHISNLGRYENPYKAPTFLETASTGSLFKAGQSQRNNAWFGSINILPHITETFETKLNLDYYSDKAVNEKYSRSIIKTDPNNPVIIEESVKNNYKPKYFNAKLYARKFFSKKSSLENTLKYSRLRNSNEQTGNMNEIAQFNNISSKDHYINNQTIYSFRVHQKLSFLFTGTLASDESPEQFVLNPGYDFQSGKHENTFTNVQDIYSKKQSIGFSGNLFGIIDKKQRININISGNVKNTYLLSELFENGRNLFSVNEIRYNSFIPRATFNYEFEVEKIRFNPELSIGLYKYNHAQLVSSITQKSAELINDAKINFSFIPNRKNRFTILLQNSESAPLEKRLYNKFILVSNRQLTSNALSFRARKTQSAGLSYKYDNLMKRLSAGLQVSLYKNDRDYLVGNQITSDISYQTFFLSDKGSSGYSGKATIRGYIPWIKSDVRFNSSYNYNKYYNALNSNQIRENRNKMFSNNLNIQTRFIWKFVFENTTGIIHSVFYSDGIEQVKNKSLNNNFTLIFLPLERMKLRSTFNYSVPSTKDFKKNNQFLDTQFEYKNKKGNIMYRIEGNNLLNQKTINTINNSDYYEIFTNQALQTRYFLFSVELRF